MSGNNEPSKQHVIDKQIKYVDLEKLQYEYNVLLFLRKKLDSFAIDCFRKIVNQHNKEGLNKTKLDDYVEHRKRYDASFLTLEVQGFVEKRSNGISKPYFLTTRGLQLVHLLKEEKEKENNVVAENKNIGGLS